MFFLYHIKAMNNETQNLCGLSRFRSPAPSLTEKRRQGGRASPESHHGGVSLFVEGLDSCLATFLYMRVNGTSFKGKNNKYIIYIS